MVRHVTTSRKQKCRTYQLITYQLLVQMHVQFYNILFVRNDLNLEIFTIISRNCN